MLWRVAGGLLLAASLAGNAYLLVDHPAVLPPPPPPPIAAVAPPPPPPEPARVVPAAVASLDRGSLERRVAEAEARLAPLLPTAERFALGERMVEHEASLRPELDELFVVAAGAAPPYELECRGQLCRLDSEEDADDWRYEIQFYPFARFTVVEVGRTVYLRVKER